MLSRFTLIKYKVKSKIKQKQKVALIFYSVFKDKFMEKEA